MKHRLPAIPRRIARTIRGGSRWIGRNSSDVLLVIGGVTIAGGVGWIHQPTGVIVLGLFLVALAALKEIGRGNYR